MQEKHQKHFKAHIIYTRFAFYLVAHFILLSMNPRVVVGVLNKLLESQLIIAGV
jgi:hypothetical protein